MVASYSPVAPFTDTAASGRSGAVAAQFLHSPGRVGARAISARTPPNRLCPDPAARSYHQFDIVDLSILNNPSRATDYMNAVARRNRTGMERVGPSCSRRQCAAHHWLPGSNLRTGSAAPKTADLGERPRPDFPACTGVPEGDHLTYVHVLPRTPIVKRSTIPPTRRRRPRSVRSASPTSLICR
jgi:hypothetical protein